MVWNFPFTLSLSLLMIMYVLMDWEESSGQELRRKNEIVETEFIVCMAKTECNLFLLNEHCQHFLCYDYALRSHLKILDPFF